MPIKWGASKADTVIIHAIVSRAIRDGYVPMREKLDFTMDVAATHLNGCRLRLADWLNADAFNFAHDVGGIRRHLDRETAKLLNCFWPRFAQPQQSRRDHAISRRMASRKATT